MNKYNKKVEDSVQAEMVQRNKIIQILVGSKLYGTSTPESDNDYMGIFMPDEEYVFGLQRINEIDLSFKSKKENGKNTADAIDDKFYEFRQYLTKAIDCNPNIIELMFVNSKNIMFINEIGRELLANRHIFPSKILAKKKFLGYAFSQKHKMRIKTEHYTLLKAAHNYFAEFLSKDLAHDVLRERNKMLTAVFVERLNPDFLIEYEKHFNLGDLNVQKGLHLANVKAMVDARFSKVTHRKGLMEKYGFDTKFGSHLIRLMLEGKELLETGELSFPLNDSQLILDIKQGKYPMTEVLEMSDHLEDEIEAMLHITDLPEKPRYREVQELCMRLMKSHLDIN